MSSGTVSLEVAMKPGSKKDRRTEFEARPGGQPSLHVAALRSVQDLLHLAHRDRHGRMYQRIKDHEANHTTEHAVGIVVLVVAAFESWVNEILADRGWHEAVGEGDSRPTLQLAARDLRSKVAELLRAGSDPAAEISAEFDLLMTLRNEFTHGLPRWWEGRNRPVWADRLEALGLLGHPDQGSDFPWSHQYTTYKVAWWACCTVEEEAWCIGAAVGGLHQSMAANFGEFRRHAPAPEALLPWGPIE